MLEAPLLRVESLSKAFSGTLAVDDVSFDVNLGQTTALIGENGAGKTTTVSLIAGTLRPDSGRIILSPDRRRDAQRNRAAMMGLAPQKLGIYPPLSVRENLLTMADLFGLRARRRKARVDACLEIFMLDSIQHQQAGTISGGQQRRLHTAMALLVSPPLLALDEPTVGADIEMRRDLIRMLKDYVGQGNGLLYTTHYLSELEELDPAIVVLKEGRVIFRGGLDSLRALDQEPIMTVSFAGPAPEVPVARGSSAISIHNEDDVWVIGAPTPSEAIAWLAENVPISPAIVSVELSPPGLDRAFLALIAKEGSPNIEKRKS